MYCKTRLGRWFYTERGAPKKPSDPTIILLHGLLFDGGMWSRQIEPLASLGRVVVFDNPGHGRSDVPPPFSLEDHADALTDAMRELQIDRAIFCGLSWGAMTAMRVAIRHPSRVAGLALMNTRATPEDARKVIEYRALLAFVSRYGLPTWLAERKVGPILFSEKMRRENPDSVEKFTRTVNGYPREGVVRATKAVEFGRSDVLEALRDVRVPTLVIAGRHDVATPPIHSEAIAKRIPNCQLGYVECGHMSAIEHSDGVNALLVPFVREVMGHVDADGHRKHSVIT